MNIQRYRAILSLDSRERPSSFDGGRTRQAIENVLGTGFLRSELTTKLRRSLQNLVPL